MILVRRRIHHYLKYLASFGITLGIIGLVLVYEYQSWGSVCSFSTGSSSPISHIYKPQLQSKISTYPSQITLVSVMCHGPELSENGTTTTISPTSRKGISRQISQMQVMLKSLLLMEHEFLSGIKKQERINNNDLPSSEIGGSIDKQTLELILYTDYKEYYDQIVEYLYNSNEISSEYLKPLKLVYSPVVYPKGYENLKYFFRPCTTLRLFMDRILPSHNEIVYLDTDIIFMKPVRELYNEFFTFNATQWAAMGMDWYHHHRHNIPYYGSQGLNAGVGLYNLTKMRESNFSKSLDSIFEEYLNRTKYADQDILNIYFHFHPQELKLLPCHRNYIPNYCRTENLCPSISKIGVTILHGITMSFMPETDETLFLVTFQFYKSLQLNKVQSLQKIEQKLKITLCENEKKLKISFTYREENCAKNLKFAEALLGQ